MRPHRLVLILALAVSLCGCGGGGSSEEKLRQVEQSLVSWRATLQLVRENWGRGSVTDRYVRQIVKAAQEDLGKQEEQLAKAPQDDAKRKELQGVVADVRQRAQRLLDNLDPSKPQATGPSLPPPPRGGILRTVARPAAAVTAAITAAADLPVRRSMFDVGCSMFVFSGEAADAIRGRPTTTADDDGGAG